MVINTFLPNVSQLNTSVLSNLNLSKEDVQNNHTLYPLYKLSISVRKDSARHYNILGGKNEINLKNYKYCSTCIEEDRLKFGEAYWHRVHNIPGIILCSKHNVFLSTWKIPLNQISKRSLFCLEEVLIEPVISKQNDNKDLLEFTRRVAKALLEQNIQLKKNIIELSVNSGLLVKAGKRSELQLIKFSDLIQNFFKDINIFPGTNFRRIRAALSPANKFCDPLTLIAIGLLCDKIQSTPQCAIEVPKFACNNIICPQYGTKTEIESAFYELNHCKTEGLLQKCSACGYSVIINLKRNKQLCVVDFGVQILESVLKMGQAGKSFRHISKKLGIDRKVASKIFSNRTSQVKDLTPVKNEALIAQRRNYWIDYLKNNSVTNLSKLEGLEKTVFRFLQINDSPWLMAHNKKAGLKKVKSSGRTKSFFNDAEVLTNFCHAKENLLKFNIHRRVSKQLILEHSNIRGLTPSKISLLENSSHFLSTEYETLFDWKKRRIKNFIETNKDTSLTPAQILDKFKAYRNTKSEKQELTSLVETILNINQTLSN